jgi:hypothetical protein
VNSIVQKIYSFFKPHSKPSGENITLHFSQSYCKIYYHSDVSAIHLDWSAQSTPEEFIKACEFSLALLKKTKAKKIIADNSKVTEVSVENQNWLTEDWFPRAIEEGFQYSAVIHSDMREVHSALRLIVSKINSKHVIVQYFSDLPSAKIWLSKIK